MRIEPAKGQTLRVVYTQEAVPANRESVFYLNTLDIPPNLKPSEGSNIMRIAFRTRIKVFLRPDGLPGTPEQAASHLKWKLVRDTSGAYALECSNNSAYHVSFNDVGLVHAGKLAETDVSMVAPHSTARFVMKNLITLPTGPLEVRYTTINDYGAAVEHPQQLIAP
jgi:chaperone protein EcpD